MTILKTLLTSEESAAIGKFLNTNERIKDLTITDLSNICYFIVNTSNISESLQSIKINTAALAVLELQRRADDLEINLFL